MQKPLRASSSDLLACFFSECEKRFRFLEQRHGYSYLSGMATYKNNYKIIVPYTHTSSVQDPFLAVTRYEKDNHALEILYGDDDYIMEVFIYIDPITRISLKDLMAAKRVPYAMPDKMSWVTQNALIEKMVQAFAHTVKEHKKSFLLPDAKLVERALTMRSKLTEQTVRAHYKKGMEDASVRAAQAYMQKNYQEAVETLEPFEKNLSKSDLKKLKLARENLDRKS